MKSAVNIVIVSYNTSTVLRNCLNSLEIVTLPHRVFVVDNASADGSVTMVRGEFPNVQIIANRENLGFAAACNQGIGTAEEEFILILNPDTVVHPQAIETLLEPMKSRADVAICAPRIVNVNGTLQYSCRRFPTLRRLVMDELGFGRFFPRSRLFGDYRMSWWAHNDRREVDQPMGAALLLRRKALDEVGGFDERFFMYFEEVDLCYRLRQRGWRILFVPEAQVIHHGGQSAKQHLVAMTLARYRSMFVFFCKHYPRWHLIVLKCVVAVAAAVRVVLYSLPRLAHRDKRAAFARVLAQIVSL